MAHSRLSSSAVTLPSCGGGRGGNTEISIGKTGVLTRTGFHRTLNLGVGTNADCCLFIISVHEAPVWRSQRRRRDTKSLPQKAEASTV